MNVDFPRNGLIGLGLLLLLSGCTSAGEKLALQADQRAAAGEPEQAMTSLRQALGEDPGDEYLRQALQRIGTAWAEQRLQEVEKKIRQPEQALIPHLDARLAELKAIRRIYELPRLLAVEQALAREREEAKQRQSLCLSLEKSPPAPEILDSARQEVTRCLQEDPGVGLLKAVEEDLRRRWVEMLMARAKREWTEKREAEAVTLLERVLQEEPDHPEAGALLVKAQAKAQLRQQVGAIAMLLEQGDSVGALTGWRKLNPAPAATDEPLALEIDRLSTRLGGILLEQAREQFVRRHLGSSARALAGAVELAPVLRLRPETDDILAALEVRSAHYLDQELPGNAFFAQWLAEKIREGRGGFRLAKLRRQLEQSVQTTWAMVPLGAALGLESFAEPLERRLIRRVMTALGADVAPAPRSKGDAIKRQLTFDASGLGEVDSAAGAGREQGVGYVLLGRLEALQVHSLRNMEHRPVKVPAGERQVPNPAHEAFQQAHPEDWKKLEEAGQAPPATVGEMEYRTELVEEGEVIKNAVVRLHLRLISADRGEVLLSRVFDAHREERDRVSPGLAAAGIAPDPEALPGDEELLGSVQLEVLESAAEEIAMLLGAREQERAEQGETLFAHGEGHAAIEKYVEAWTLARLKKLDPLPYQTRLEELAERVW